MTKDFILERDCTLKKLVARKEEAPVMTKAEIISDLKESIEELKACQRGEKEMTSWEDFKKYLHYDKKAEQWKQQLIINS